MLLRFLDIQPSISAGPTASIPSHIGKEDKGQVLGTLAPNGTIMVDPAEESASVFHSGEGLAEAEQIELDQMREAYYGPRRTTTLVLVLMGITAILYVLLRFRKGRRKTGGYGRVRDGLAPMKMEAQKRRHHKSSVGRKKTRNFESGGGHRQNGGLGGRHHSNPSTVKLMADGRTAREEDEGDLEAGESVRGSTEENPDLAGDISLSPTKDKTGRVSTSSSSASSSRVDPPVGRVLFDRP